MFAELVSLFFLSVLAATIIPFGCEIYFSALVIRFPEHALYILIIATLGNNIGSMITFQMAKFFGEKKGLKFFKVSETNEERAKKFIDKIGIYASFFCFAPIIGDVIAVVFGILKANFLRFSIIMGLGKLTRFYFLAHLTEAVSW